MVCLSGPLHEGASSAGWAGAGALPEQLAAGHGNDRTRDIGRCRRCEEHERGRQLSRLGGATERRVRAELTELLSIRRRGDERSPDRSRSDDIHADPALGQHA